MIENQLKQLGFGKNEIKIYLALFELGKCKAHEVIVHTGLHRNIVYQDLEDLVKRGLVTKTEVKNVFEYSANNPEALVEEFENKKEISQKIAEQLKEKQIETPREVAVYEGVDGLKKSRAKILNYQSGDEVFIFGADLEPSMEKVMRKIHKKREDAGINMKILYDQSANKSDVAWRNTLEHSKAKLLPFSQKFPIWFAGIGEHLEIGIPQHNNPLIFNIRNQEAVDGFKTFFDYFWNQESISYQGIDEVESAYNEILENSSNDQDVVIFAAKPSEQRSSNFNLEWNKQLRKKVKRLRLLYYGANEINISRAKEMLDVGAEAKVSGTSQSLPISTIIAGDVVLTVVWDKNPACFKIKNKTVADSLKNNFELLWNQQVGVESGLDPLKNIIYEMLDELNSGEEYCVLGASYGHETGGGQELYDKFHNDRIKKGVVTKMLVYRESFERIKKRFERCGDQFGKVSQLKQYGSAPKIPMQINLYNNKAFIIFYGESPTVIKFNRPEFFAGFKTYFDELWRKGG